MKVVVIGLLSLFFCSVLSREFRALPESPVINFPAKAPALLLANLPRKIVDPTDMIKAAAAKHKVQAALVKSIVKAESAFNANAVSPKGAIGLMQLMPETAEQFGIDPLNPE